jgi:hypothetical protein
MNLIKFVYDVFVYLTCNYSHLSKEFIEKFPYCDLVKVRLFLSDLVQEDSDLNENFKKYE